MATYSHLPSSSNRFLLVNGAMYSCSSANCGVDFSSRFTIFRPSRPKSLAVLFLVFQEFPFAIVFSIKMIHSTPVASLPIGLRRRKFTLFSSKSQRFAPNPPTFNSFSRMRINPTTVNILFNDREYIAPPAKFSLTKENISRHSINSRSRLRIYRTTYNIPIHGIEYIFDILLFPSHHKTEAALASPAAAEQRDEKNRIQTSVRMRFHDIDIVIRYPRDLSHSLCK